MNKALKNKNNLLNLLSELEDPRRPQGRMHTLPFILLVSIMAIMNGSASYYAIRDFFEINKKDLFKLFKLRKNKKRLPSRVTILRLFSSIDFDKLKLLFYNWASSQISIKKGDILSLDGKSIRGTVTNPNNSLQNFTSIVSVFYQKKKQILCLERMETKKSSEISVVQELIKILDLEGVTLTMDSLHCQKKTVKSIIENKNNYLIQVKGNQKKLYEDLKKTPHLAN